MNKYLRLMIFLVSISFLVTATFSSAHAAICKVGDKAKVLWKGSWYAATVTKAKDNKCYIHYDGYRNSWDEWVGADRIKIVEATKTKRISKSSSYEVGEAVMVKWKSKWWPAHILKAKADRWYIHYDGYRSSWDEWVESKRIKKK